MKIRAASWNRFVSTSLAVSPEAMGSEHRFRFRDRTVSVHVPDVGMADRGDGFDNVAECRHWKTVNGKQIPLSYDVYKIDLYVDLLEPINIPPIMLQSSPKQDHLISKTVAEQFEYICTEHEQLAYMAFEYWIRVLRWKSQYWRIGQPEVIGRKSGWGTYLVSKRSKKRFWIGVRKIIARRHHIVTLEEMNAVQKAVKTQDEPPIWIEYLSDAEHKFDNGDFNGCILSLAISCESIFRRIVEEQIPDNNNVDPQVFATLSEINIRSMFKYITKYQFWGAQWKGHCNWQLINNLFDKRNDIIHAGFRGSIEEKQVDKIKAAVSTFVIFANQHLHN